MTIQKINNYLCVRSNIYFDNECCFCGRPYISLTAHRDKDKFWEENTITIAIHDMDDFDYGLIYKTNPDDFINVLRELINWMRDHEQGISIYDENDNKSTRPRDAVDGLKDAIDGFGNMI